jgi:hypothetical protein
LYFPAGTNRAQITENGNSIESNAGVELGRGETSGAGYQDGAGTYAFSLLSEKRVARNSAPIYLTDGAKNMSGAALPGPTRQPNA